VCRDADRSGKVVPAGPAGNLLFVIAEIEKPAAAEAGVFAAIGCKTFPEIEALCCDRQLARVTILLPAPSPIAAGLLRADPTLFDKGDAQPRSPLAEELAQRLFADFALVGP